MAAHDFASKKKTSKPKANNSKKKPVKKVTTENKKAIETPPKSKKKIPAIVWIVLGVSIAFGGQHAIKALKSNPEVNSAIESASVTLSETTEKILEPVKEIKEEAPRFEFYELLKNNKVEVNITEDTATTKKKFVYIVQAGSFRKKADAEHMRSQLILNNLTNATTDSITTKNGTWYRVNVGPFTNRSKLEKARDTLAAMNIQDLVKKVPIEK
jgi:cell division protein FtsN